MTEQKAERDTATLTVCVENATVPTLFGAHPLAGKVFYVLDKDLSTVLKANRNAIWGDLQKKSGLPSEGSGRILICEILNSPDSPRKYPAALILTAESLSRMNLLTNTSYAKAMDALRVQAVKFFVFDAVGAAKIEGLKPSTYYICGTGEINRKSGVWNVRVDLKPGANRLNAKQRKYDRQTKLRDPRADA